MATNTYGGQEKKRAQRVVGALLSAGLVMLLVGCAQEEFPIARTDPYSLVRTAAVVDGQTAVQIQSLGVAVPVADASWVARRCSAMEAAEAIKACLQRQKLCDVKETYLPPISFPADSSILSKYTHYLDEQGKCERDILTVKLSLGGSTRCRRTPSGLYIRVDYSATSNVHWAVDTHGQERSWNPKEHKVLIESDVPAGEALVAIKPIGKAEDVELYALLVWATRPPEVALAAP